MTELDSLQTQLDALNSARASNVLSIRYGNGEQITYRSTQEVIDQINYIVRRMNELRRVQAGGTRHGISVARFGRR